MSGTLLERGPPEKQDAPAARLGAMLEQRTGANASFFAEESERLARLCHRMAERFSRGGRLIALGTTPASRSDARHVAVEFVHPVIVGKRALPAIGAHRRGRPSSPAQVDLLARAVRTSLIAFGDRPGGQRDRGARSSWHGGAAA